MDRVLITAASKRRERQKNAILKAWIALSPKKGEIEAAYNHIAEELEVSRSTVARIVKPIRHANKH